MPVGHSNRCVLQAPEYRIRGCFGPGWHCVSVKARWETDTPPDSQLAATSLRASTFTPAAMSRMPMWSRWRPGRSTSMPDTTMHAIIPTTIGVRVSPPQQHLTQP